MTTEQEIRADVLSFLDSIKDVNPQHIAIRNSAVRGQWDVVQRFLGIVANSGPQYLLAPDQSELAGRLAERLRAWRLNGGVKT